MSEKTSLADVQLKAIQTAARFVEVGSYGGRESGAVAALHKRCPGWDREDCRAWFLKAVAVYKSGVGYMQPRAVEATDLYRKSQTPVDLSPIAGEFFKQHPEFSREALNLALFVILDWYHLR